jgi:peptidyl-prolyl cis-trans isomerase SurA
LILLEKKLKKKHQYHLSGLIIPIPKDATKKVQAEKHQQAQQFLAQLQGGKSFTAISVNHSELKGGDMGWNQLEQLPPPVAKQLKNAHQGQLIGPIKTAQAFYILKITATKPLRYQQTEYHLRRIVLTPSQVDNDATMKGQLKLIRKRISEGKLSFAEAAKKYSQDQSSANGGDLGWVNLQNLPPAVAKQVKKLNPEQMSQPFKTRSGWQIMQTLGHKQVDNTKQILTQQARQQIYQQQFQQALVNWIYELRGDAYIKIMLNDDTP